MSKSTLAVHSANTWMVCNGSVSLQQQFPPLSTENNSEARLEGLAFHEVAQRILESFKNPSADCLVSKPHVVGTVSNHGIVITDEIYDGALDYSNDVLKVCNVSGTMQEMHIEEHLDLSIITGGMYGYVDCWLFDAKKLTLYVWEGKFGHRYVDAFENWQLIIYVQGILEHLKINGHADQHITVKMRIAQPRSFSGNGMIREWECTASDLRGHFNQVIDTVTNILRGDVKCKTSLSCQTCCARYGCSTLQADTAIGMDYVGEALGVSLSGHNLGFELSQLKRIETLLKARMSGLEEQAIAVGGVPGFSVHRGNGRQRWKKDVPHDEIIAMGDLMGLDIRKPCELDTPAKVIKKGIDESVISEYSETPLTAPKLIKEDKAKIRQMFKTQ